MEKRIQKYIPIFFTMPPIIIGAITMYYNKISAFIWMQNIGCLLIAGLLSCFVVSSKYYFKRNRLNGVIILVSLFFLILTFISPSMDGVHRWVSIGILKFNVSMIVVPMLLIALWELLQIKKLLVALFYALLISILLAFQPDASQLTGFAIPIIIMLCNKTDRMIYRAFILGAFSILCILSWVFLDSLPAVSYVEGIISLLANVGVLWFLLGVISLIILPLPFLFYSPRNHKLPSISIGLYFVIILISTIFGNFPVPLMGYGISPIIGYFLVITWYAKLKVNS